MWGEWGSTSHDRAINRKNSRGIYNMKKIILLLAAILSFGNLHATGEIRDDTIIIPNRYLEDYPNTFLALLSGGGKCLDIHAPDLHNNGAKVQTWECNNSVQQSWVLTENGSVINEAGKCLDVHAPDFNRYINGGKVQAWDCHGGSNQRWRIENGSLVSDNGMCLDVHALDLHSNGAKVQIWQCNGAVQQKWYY